MRYRLGWLAEVLRYERCQEGAARTERGLAQFHAYESRGVQPDSPDLYFIRLLNGKKWWEWTINEYAALYGKPEWPGWWQLGQDFGDDRRGLVQIRARLGRRVGHLPKEGESCRR